MGIAQEIINEDDTYELANQILMHDLPDLDSCDDDERETFLSECRWAIGEKVRQVALLHAFAESQNGEEQSLTQLCASAQNKISDSSYIASVQEFVLGNLNLRDREELHPNLETVEAQTLITCNRIIKILNLEPKLPTTQKFQESFSVRFIDRKRFNKNDELGNGNSLSA